MCCSSTSAPAVPGGDSVAKMATENTFLTAGAVLPGGASVVISTTENTFLAAKEGLRSDPAQREYVFNLGSWRWYSNLVKMSDA